MYCLFFFLFAFKIVITKRKEPPKKPTKTNQPKKYSPPGATCPSKSVLLIIWAEQCVPPSSPNFTAICWKLPWMLAARSEVILHFATYFSHVLKI